MKPADVYTLLSINVDSFNVRSSASQNIDLLTRDTGLSREDDLALEFETRLEILGTCTYPEERATDRYEISIIGAEIHAGDFSKTLRDFQVKDEYYAPVYRKYRGREIPVYEAPSGIGFLNKVRGENCWGVASYGSKIS